MSANGTCRFIYRSFIGISYQVYVAVLPSCRHTCSYVQGAPLFSESVSVPQVQVKRPRPIDVHAQDAGMAVRSESKQIHINNSKYSCT